MRESLLVEIIFRQILTSEKFLTYQPQVIFVNNVMFLKVCKMQN